MENEIVLKFYGFESLIDLEERIWDALNKAKFIPVEFWGTLTITITYNGNDSEDSDSTL